MAKLDFEMEITNDEIDAIFHRLVRTEDCDAEINKILGEYQFDVSQLEFDSISTIALCLKYLEGLK